MNSTQKRSYRAVIASNCFVRVGDTLSDPKTILTWLLSALGAPAFVVSLLVPIRESGSMLPQIFLASFIQKFRTRKPIYISGLIAQFLAIISIGIAALTLSPLTAGYIAISALAVFATARAFCSITAKDILGRSIPKGSRGKLSGTAAMLSGIVATILAILLLGSRDQQDTDILASIIIIAACMWLLSGIAYSFVHEQADEQAATMQTQSIKKRLALVKDDALFRNFILARTLLLGSSLASPIFVVMAHSAQTETNSGSSAHSLIAFIVAGSLATAFSSTFWGKFSDKASHLSLFRGGMLTALIGSASIIIYYLLPELASLPYTWPVMFFLFNIGYMGVRLGRTTWVVDAAEGNKRTDYVAASNTIIAVLILLLGLIAAPLQIFSPVYAMALYTFCCFSGAVIALRIKIS